jgi:uncharacterized membrane protein YeaQ/YmgE (transglycosylase-associated protein family)
LALSILSWIVLGAFAGWITVRVLKGNQFRPWVGTILGMIGALAGGFLMHYGGMPGHIEVVSTTLSAIFGAVVLTAFTAYLNGRRRYA